MAKVETQCVPSDDRIKYKRHAQVETKVYGTVYYVRSRYPWRVPISQAGGRAVSSGQIKQRDRFLYVKNKYKLLSKAAKKRWRDANPEYKSFLFGYDFFMMEGLKGGGPAQYPQMIKTIQVHKASVPTTGGHIFNLDPTIDGSKAVVMIQGSARKVPKVVRGASSVAIEGSTLAVSPSVDPEKCTVVLHGANYDHDSNAAAWAWVVYPYVHSLTASQILIKWSLSVDQAGVVAWEITEHVEGIVLPVLVSISNTQVQVDWAEQPNAAADVSITVVEYL